ncbi:hypothetical protein RSAG8_10608, partial [Rhizoctonia solani AG-8 WAC10335]
MVEEEVAVAGEETEVVDDGLSSRFIPTFERVYSCITAVQILYPISHVSIVSQCIRLPTPVPYTHGRQT